MHIKIAITEARVYAMHWIKGRYTQMKKTKAR